jgi:hypothetical protein
MSVGRSFFNLLIYNYDALDDPLVQNPAFTTVIISKTALSSEIDQNNPKFMFTLPVLCRILL